MVQATRRGHLTKEGLECHHTAKRRLKMMGKMKSSPVVYRRETVSHGRPLEEKGQATSIRRRTQKGVRRSNALDGFV
jgi:hypothetical protein